jgi:hypothetical protein
MPATNQAQPNAAKIERNPQVANDGKEVRGWAGICLPRKPEIGMAPSEQELDDSQRSGIDP